jgi:hypothetical protein
MTAKARIYPFVLTLIFIFVAISSLPTLTFASEEYTRTEQANTSGEVKEFRLAAPANLAGSAVLEVGDEDVCKVQLECWAEARNRKMAKEFTELVEMYLETEDGVVTLRLTTPRDAPWEGTEYAIKASLEISVPPDIMVEAKTRHFRINVSGPLKGVDIRNSDGWVRVMDVYEQTTIEGSYSKVEAQNIRGNLDIETSYNSIWVRDVDTREGKAFLKTTYGKIEVEELVGRLDAHTVYNPIHCSDITLVGGASEIKTVYSTVELELEGLEDARLYVYNSYGNIDMTVPTDLSARLTLAVGRGGKIHTERILIKPQVLEKTRLEGISGDGESEIEAEISGIGKILLEGR